MAGYNPNSSVWRPQQTATANAVWGTPDPANYGSLGREYGSADMQALSNSKYSDQWDEGGQSFWRVGDLSQLDNSWAPPGLRGQVINHPVAGNILPAAARAQFNSSVPSSETWLDKIATNMPLIMGSLFTAGAVGGFLDPYTAGGMGATGGAGGGAVSGYSVPGGMSMAPIEGMSVAPWNMQPPTGFDQIMAQLGGGAGVYDPQAYGPGETGAYDQFGPEGPGGRVTPQSQMEVSDMQNSSRNATTANTGMQPGNVIEQLMQRFLPGGTGGGPGDILKQLASSAFRSGGSGGGSDSGSGWLGPLLSIGSGLYGLSESDKLKKLAASSSERADPFGPYRAGFGQQLQDLWKNPGSVTKLPGYEAGEQAVQRSMAAQGYQGSGNMATAMQKYGGDFFNNAVSQLSGLAGANFNPAGGASLNLQGNTSAIDLAGRSLASIGYGARGTDTFSELLRRLAL